MSMSSLQSGTVDDATQAADKFLAFCVRATLADAPLPPWPFGSAQQSSLPEADLADALIRRAEFHGIALLLTYRGTQGSDWPGPVMAQLTQLARLSGLWEELHRPRIAGLIDMLADRGVASIVLKGSALAYLHYPDPALRRRGDTDLLIRPEDLDTTRAALREAGWISPPPSRGLYFQESWDIDCGLGMLHTLDLHWHPTDRPVIQKVLRPEDYWASTRPLPRLSPRAAAPDPVIMLVHGAINQFWHETRGILVEGERVVGGRRLIWAADYHHMTEGLTPADWERLAAFCAARDAGGIVHAVLAGAQQDIGLALPDGFPERLLPASGRSPTMDYIRRFDRLKDIRADFMAADSTATRLRLLSASVLVSREQLVKRYPNQAHWPTALLQLRRYGGALARVIGLSQRGAAYQLRHAPEKQGPRP